MNTTNEPQDEEAARDLRVVLVEHDDELRGLCTEVLRAAGIDVEACASQSAAFEAVLRVAPDVLVLDRDLPDGSGLDVARWIRSQASYDHVRVVCFSARKSAPEIARALAAGCDAFLGKPCGPAALVREIRAGERHLAAVPLLEPAAALPLEPFERWSSCHAAEESSPG